jgi:hypothetical protein
LKVIDSFGMPYPSFNGQLRAPALFAENEELRKLYWIMQDPMADAVFLLNDPKDPDGARQPAFRKHSTSESNVEDDGQHPTLKLSLYEQPISSAMVSIDNIESEVDWWEAQHCYWEEDDRDGPCRCCGRPPPVSQILTVKAKTDEDFVTIGDYIVAVHRWIMSLREDLLWACEDEPESRLPDDAVLLLDVSEPSTVWIHDPEEWARDKRRYG